MSDAAFETKERVKQAVDIVDLVQSYLPLRREGRNFKALCPWHDDTRPSLQVNPERQSFRCWVCDIGGDIFSFVMKIEGITFPEALAMLADRCGIPLDSRGRGDAPPPVDDKRVLYQAMAWACGQYHKYLLDSPDAAAARDYLAQRNVAPECVRGFQLGFAPDRWDWIAQQAAATPFNPAMLERIGLVSRRRNGPGYYDRFKGRVLFPIFDAQGRAVGLGGRILPALAAQDAAKYVNSPETPLFAKSHLLYGLNVARDAIRRSGTAIVTEGYTDCIAAHQFGFTNTVAVLGTALGSSHIQLLRRYADRVRVVLVLDGDEAGRRRAKEVLELFVSANVDLRVLTLPDDADPADYLFRHGAAAFEKLIAGAEDALSHAFRSATAGFDIQRDTHAAAQALEQLVATIARAPRLRSDTQIEDRLREEKFLQRLGADFRVSETQVRELMTALRRKTAARQVASEPSASFSKAVDPLERELLEILLNAPQEIARVWGVVAPAHLTSPELRRVFTTCGQLWAKGILPVFDRLLLEIDDPVVKNLLVDLDESGRAKASAELEHRLHDVLSGFERRQREQNVRGRAAALKQGQLPKEDELAVLLELERLERARQQEHEARARQGISDLTDG
jgi:DNA primase